MKLHHTLISCFFFFFLSLQEGNTAPVDAEIPLYAVTEGQDLSVECHLLNHGGEFRRFLCREKCEENILIETTNYRAQRGRYKIVKHYLDTGFSVTITQVKKSDAGQYRCGHNFTESIWSSFFGILVLDSATAKPDSNLLTVSPSLLVPSKQATDVLMYSVVVLVIVVIILVLALTTICIRRKIKSDGSMTRGNTGGLNIENALYENFPPVSKSENSDYLTLHPATRDHNQIYSTLTNTQNTQPRSDSGQDYVIVL